MVPPGVLTDSVAFDGIILVSTATVDRRPAVAGIEEMPGGPAHYIGMALKRLGCPYLLLSGERALVDVLPVANGEQQYRIPALPPINLPTQLEAAAVILSPIMQEIEPTTVPEVRGGPLVVDLQGFVREPLIPTGETRRAFDVSELIERAQVVKASIDELDRLTVSSREALAGTLLLLTQGSSGVRLRSPNLEVFIASRKIRTTHTIGAGDTFLACFVYHLTRGAAPPEAAESAARFTEEVLAERVVPGSQD